jgi:hypothetical protein
MIMSKNASKNQIGKQYNTTSEQHPTSDLMQLMIKGEASTGSLHDFSGSNRRGESPTMGKNRRIKINI